MNDKAEFHGRRWHDMGGLPAGDVIHDGHDFAIWEKRVDALLSILSRDGRMTVDGLRRVLEDMDEKSFETMSYYERWMASVTRNCMESGIFSLEELNAKLEEVAARGDTYAAAARPVGALDPDT